MRADIGRADPDAGDGVASASGTVEQASSMQDIKRKRATPGFDEDGFLIDPLSWTPEMAVEVARRDGLSGLQPQHWEVIAYLRQHYLQFGTLPVMSHVCRVNHLDRNCVYDLFRNPREAWRIAGLPNPGEEARAYM